MAEAKPKSAEKIVKPTDKQRAVLEALTSTRQIVVTRKASSNKTRSTVELRTASGNDIEGAPALDRSAVERCHALGWVTEVAGQGDGETVVKVYRISDEGKKARRLK